MARFSFLSTSSHLLESSDKSPRTPYPRHAELIRDQRSELPSIDELKKNLTGKTIIVVGANTGLGLEGSFLSVLGAASVADSIRPIAARHFATMNPGRLILACRTAKTAEEAVQGICLSSSPKPTDIQ